MHQQDTTQTGGNATAKCEEKPQRLPDDPDGFDPAFDDKPITERCFGYCALANNVLCRKAPCWKLCRPEGRFIYYVKSEAEQ